MTVRACAVSYEDHRGITHSVQVQADTLFEAAVYGVKALRADPWMEPVGESTPLTIEVKEPASTHVVTLQQVERWISSVSTSPADASRKTRLKMMLMRG